MADGIIEGGPGDDRLEGRDGDYVLRGKGGNDVYIVEQGDIVDEKPGEGFDRVFARTNYILATGAEVEQLATFDYRLTSFILLRGNELNNPITGNNGDNSLDGLAGSDYLTGLEGNDRLDGGTGRDHMVGGLGNDIYIVDEPLDTVIEHVGQGLDYLFTSTTFLLQPGTEIELFATSNYLSTDPLALTGNELNNAITGNNGNNTMGGAAGDDHITGLEGHDIMDGGTGADWMVGGLGNDVYYVDHARDTIQEAAGEGFDYAFTSASYTLTAGAEIELFGTRDYTSTAAIDLTGNELNNLIVGSNGNNILNGGAGADSLTGLLGDDSFVVDHADDLIVEAAGEGTDTVLAGVSYVLRAGVHVEIMRTTDQSSAAAINLTGNAFANSFHGNAGANLLVGGGGADIFHGHRGDDSYAVDSADDLVFEAAGEGADTVLASASYSLAAGSHVETLSASDRSSFAALDLGGNELANTIHGNAGANVLSGGGGQDALHGHGGGDSYYVDSDDQVFEAAGEGSDTVFASASFTLGAGVHVEVLTTSNPSGTTAIDLTGNELANTLHGNAGANVLRGGGGADSMFGHGGDDSYHVDGSDDQVGEAAGEGIDTVFAGASYTLAAGASIEVLRTSDQSGTAAIDLTGNALANTIHGNAGANVLSGGGGEDSFHGHAGNDIYHVDSAGDLVFEALGEGTDTVIAIGNYTLAAGSYVEILAAQAGTTAIDLTGNALDNELRGNDGANLLDGGGGPDTLIGNGGADVYAFTTALGGANVDTIVGFQGGIDRILLGGFAGQPFAALSSGALVASAFRTGSSAFDSDDRIIYDSSRGELFYDPDGTGSAAQILFAKVSGQADITAASFTVSGVPNSPPTISSPSTASVAENSHISTVVYQTVASDPDGDSLIFRLSGQDAGSLTIDSAGAVRLNSSPDYEAKQSYSFTVEVVDSGGLSASRAVTLSIIDVVESLPRYALAEQEDNGSNGSAQPLDRSRFTPANDSTVPDTSLPSATITGNVAAGGDKDFFRVTLNAGELLILDVDGTNSLDAELRVFDPNGTLIAINDDPGFFDAGSTSHSGLNHNLDSFIRVRAPMSGTYTFSIQSFVGEAGATTSGGYTLHAVIGPAASRAQINEENIQALVSGSVWSTTSLTYGFPTSGSQYGSNGSDEIAAGMQALSGTQQATVNIVLRQVADLTNLSFTQLSSNPGSAQMRYALSGDPDTAHAYYPGAGDGGDSWYNTTRYNNPIVGNYQWLTFVHETGHALGLKHGHESPALSPDRDSLEYSVMTYRSYIGDSVEDQTGYRNETFGFPQTFMMYDIAALQRMYGADFTTNAGDTVYSWSPMNGAFLANGTVQWMPGGNRIFMTLWDGGGIDAIDLSAYDTSTIIDLRPGEWITISSVQLANLGGPMARGNVANALMFNNDPRSLIENAIGGTGADRLIANETANRLTGNAGGDRFVWNALEDSRPGAADTVTDFQASGGDMIDLSGIDAIAATAGNDAFRFIGTNAFSGSAGELRYQVMGGNAHIFADVNGDGVADLEIVLLNTTILTGNEFAF